MIASTDASIDSGSLLDFLSDTRGNHGGAFVKFRGKLLQVVAVPVRDPDTIGWICMGFAVGGDVMAQIKDVAGTEISLIQQSSAAMPTIVASTLPDAAWESMDKQRMVSIADGHGTHAVSLQGVDYLTRVTLRAGDIGDSVFAVVQVPKDAAAGRLAVLHGELIGWGGIVTVLCLIAALLSARLLSQPVRALANAARSLRLSKRRRNSNPAGGDDELASLAVAFHALAHRAHYDALTGLPNRALVAERINAGITRAKRDKFPLAVVFIDLNGFKKINDDLGHEMGDLVLRKIAKRLTRSMRPSDTVARLGGDEFVLVLEGVGSAGALKLVDQLMPIVALPMRSAAGPITVGMSAGIAAFPDHGRDRETLLRMADAAMYQSKTRRLGPVVAKAPVLPAGPVAAPVERSDAGEHSDTGTHSDSGEFVDAWDSGRWKDKDLSTQNLRATDVRKDKAALR